MIPPQLVSILVRVSFGELFDSIDPWKSYLFSVRPAASVIFSSHIVAAASKLVSSISESGTDNPNLLSLKKSRMTYAGLWL